MYRNVYYYVPLLYRHAGSTELLVLAAHNALSAVVKDYSHVSLVPTYVGQPEQRALAHTKGHPHYWTHKTTANLPFMHKSYVVIV